MGALIELYRMATRTLGGTPKPFGQVATPYASFDTGSTTGPAIDDSVVVPAGATVVLWEYGVNSLGWSWGRVEYGGGSGQVKLWWKGDTATSATDNTPTGAAITWNGVELTEKGGQEWTTRALTTNATPADHASNNAGVPTAFSDAGEVAGYIYKIVAKNPGATDVRLRRVFWG